MIGIRRFLSETYSYFAQVIKRSPGRGRVAALGMVFLASMGAMQSAHAVGAYRYYGIKATTGSTVVITEFALTVNGATNYGSSTTAYAGANAPFQGTIAVTRDGSIATNSFGDYAVGVASGIQLYIDLGSPQVATAALIGPQASCAGACAQNVPTSVVVQGSNDASTWTTLNTVTGLTAASYTGGSFKSFSTGLTVGTASISTAYNCGGAYVGVNTGCGAVATVTASGGGIVLGSTPYSLTGSTGNFTVGSSTCTAGLNMASGSTCTITLSAFDPTAVGAYNMGVSVSPSLGTAGSNGSAFSGTGVANVISIGSNGSVQCGSVTVGSSSSVCGYAWITTTGPIATSLSSSNSQIAVDNAYSGGDSTCYGHTANGANTCYWRWSYTPTTTGAISSTMTVSAPNATSLTFSATGTGAAPTLSIGGASSAACGIVQVGGSAVNCGYFYVSSNGPVNMYAISSSNSAFSYSGSSNCVFSSGGGTAINGPNGCYVYWTYTPTAAGAQSATFTVESNYGTETTYGVSGTGETVSVGTTYNACGTVAVGSTSVDCGYIYVTTAGAGATLGTPYASSSDSEFPIDTANSSCSNGAAVSGTNSCYFRFSFAPTSAGAHSSTFTINTNYGSPTVGMSGTGVTVNVGSTYNNCSNTTAGTSNVDCGYIFVSTAGAGATLSTPFATSSSAMFPIDTANSSCTNGAAVSGSNSCYFRFSFVPTAVGSESSTFTINSNYGSLTTGMTATSVAPQCSFSLTPSSTCATAPYGSGEDCPQITLTASGAYCASTVSTPTMSNGAYFSFDPNNAIGTGSGCTNASNGSTCVWTTYTNNLQTGGTAAVSLSTSNGTLSSTVYANPYFGTTSASSGTTCPDEGAGAGSSTCGATTLTVASAPVIFGASPVSSSNSAFTVISDTCASTTVGAGSTCTITYKFTPTTVGSQSTTITVTPTSGTGTSYSLSANGLAGALSASGNLSCGTSTVGTAAACGTVTLTASGGPVTLTTSAFSSSDATDFTAALGTCTAGGTIASGGSCTVTVSMTPTTTGALSDTVTVNTSSGTGTSFSASGTGYSYTWTAGPYGSCTGGAGTWAYSAWTPTTGCGTNLPQTRTGTCNANVSSGTETRAITCARNDGTTVANTFCSGTAPAASTSCTPTSGFSCGTEGALSQTFNDTSTCTYSWNAGTWGNDSSTCSTTDTQTRTVSCLQSDGTTVDNSLCAGAGTEPATSQVVANYSTCTFSWTQGGFGACTGGTGTWNYTAWAPATGCGTGLTQTRTGTCVADTNSGSASQSVTCTRSDGTTVDSSNCTGTEPATSEVCTPSSPSCGTEASLSESFNDTSTCTYAWTAGSWSAPSATCSANAAETRSVSCTQSDGTTVDNSLCAGAGTEPATTQTVPTYSGCTYSWSVGSWSASSNTCSAASTETRSVSCLQSDGSTVDNSLCAGAGTEPATSQTLADYSGCSYSWTAAGFGACTGGSATWTYGSWTPATGCGMTSQTRSAFCNQTAGSGTATQAVSCTRSDGTTVDASLCAGAGAEPATSESCTPSNASCGTEDVTSQSVALTNACNYSWSAGAYGACTGGSGAWVYTSWTPAAGSSCTASLAQTRSGTCTGTTDSGAATRTVSCQDQNGTVVDSSNCAGTAPASSETCTPTAPACGTEGALTQTVADYSSCTYSWHTSGFSACTGGTGAWTYSAWIPTCGVGPTTQTRTGTCAGTANSGHQSQTVTCQRNDGTTVANSYCTGTAPATSQTCTPSTGFSCGTEGILQQKVTLTNKCTVQNTCVPSPTNSCVTTP